jgi:hypothetical protein
LWTPDAFAPGDTWVEERENKIIFSNMKITLKMYFANEGFIIFHLNCGDLIKIIYICSEILGYKTLIYEL